MHKIIVNGINLDESFQVSTIIAKLLPLWKDCQLKQKIDAMNFRNLLAYLQIEENS